MILSEFVVRVFKRIVGGLFLFRFLLLFIKLFRFLRKVIWKFFIVVYSVEYSECLENII